MKISLAEVGHWCKTGIQNNSNIEFVYCMHREMHRASKGTDYLGMSRRVHQRLDQCMTRVDWNKSFHGLIAMVLTEGCHPDLIIELHRWLRIRSANIENVRIITTNHLGLRQWWRQWKQVMHEPSFDIVELPLNPVFFSAFLNLERHNLPEKKTQVARTFSYYGGMYSLAERNYVTLELSRYQDHAWIDSGCDLLPWTAIAEYVEQISHFMDQAGLEQLDKLYHAWSGPPRCDQAVEKESFGFGGRQWHIDSQCLATVLRETQDSAPYNNITEKTYRAFLNLCHVVPLGYRSVANLENLGFDFDHNLFDYSYQNEPDFYLRVQRVKASLEKFAQQHQASLQAVHDQTLPMLRQNQQRAVELLTDWSSTLVDL